MGYGVQIEKFFGFSFEELQLFDLFGLDDSLVEVDKLLVDDFDSCVIVLKFLENYEVSLLPNNCLLVWLRQNEYCRIGVVNGSWRSEWLWLNGPNDNWLWLWGNYYWLWFWL